MITPTLLILAGVLSASPDWQSTPRSELDVTLGTVLKADAGFLSVSGPKERGQRKTGQHQEAMLEFQYRGPSNESSRLASGRFVRQIGLKLRTKDTCNLLYVMWRIEPEEAIRIMIKRNPGKSTHDDCGARGYKSIATIPLVERGITARSHEMHRLSARMDEAEGHVRLAVSIDGTDIWSGTLDDKLIADINGPVGFRTDNGAFLFKLFVAGP